MAKFTRYVAQSPLKKVLYPVADGVLKGIGRLNALRYSVEDTILIVCPGRSGSTWLAEIVSSLSGYLVLWEPLHLGNNPSCKKAGFAWQNYCSHTGSDEAQRNYLRKVYTGRDLSTRTLTSLHFNPIDLLNIRGYVVKHVNANMILHQIMEWFPVRAVLMIRHPCAVVSSQLKHGGWAHITKENITVPDGMFTDLPHLEQVLSGLETLEELLAFEWAIQSYIPLSQPTPHPWYLTTYERLVMGGEQEVERIFEYFGEPAPASAKSDLEKPSATAGEKSHVKQGKNRLTGWTSQLNKDQVNQILETVHAVGVKCYNDSLTPDENFLPLRTDQPVLFK